MGAYVTRVLIWGPYVHPRARKEPGSVFLSRFFIDLGYWLFAKLEGAALALRITPNQLTAGSLACSVGGAVAFAVGNPGLGGGLVLGCAVLDALAGRVARTRRTAPAARELIHAAADRYPDDAH